MDTQFGRAQLERYVLGASSEAEREAIEEAYFGNDELFVEVEAIETDVIDAYVRNELDEQERSDFEQRIEGSEELQTRIALAKELQEKFGSSRSLSREREPPAATWSPLWRLAAGIVVLLAAGSFFTAWFQLRSEGERVRREAAMLQTEVQTLKRQIAEQRTALAALDQRAHPSPTVSPLPESKLLPPTLRAVPFTLAIMTRGEDGVNELLLPSNVDVIALRVPLSEGERAAKYEARIESLSGELVWKGPATVKKSGQSDSILEALVPAAALPPGRHIVTATSFHTRPSRTVVVFEESFQILKKER